MKIEVLDHDDSISGTMAMSEDEVSIDEETMANEKGEKSQYEFAESAFLGFVSTSSLYELQSSAGVVFAGLPRVGKSSAVSVQRGSYLVQSNDADGSRGFIPVSQKGDPKISNSTVAKTVNVTLFRDWKNERNIFDTPGLNDNRNTPYKIWSNFSMACTFALTESIDATCVVINYVNSFAVGANADSFRDLAHTLLENAGINTDDCSRQSYFFSNLCFMFTHVPPNAMIEGIIERLKQVVLEQMKQQVNTLTQLKRRFRKKSVVGANVGRIVGVVEHNISTLCLPPSGQSEKENLSSKIDHLCGQLDTNNPCLFNDPLYPTLAKIRASVVLLETMINAKERIILSNPVGKLECKRQREHAEKVFKLCCPLQRHQLRELANKKCIRDFVVYDILAHLAKKMAKKLALYISTMSSYLKSVDEQADVITAVNQNWRDYRDTYVIDLTKLKNSNDKERLAKENRKRFLKSSKTLVTPIRNTYRVCSEWSLWGYGYVRGTVTHTGKYDIALMVVEGKRGDYVYKENADKTEVTVTVTSELLHGIDAKIKFQCYECDLDETKDLILELDEDLVRIENENEVLSSSIRTLQAYNTRQQVMDFVVVKKLEKELNDVQKACDELNKEVRTGIFEDDKKTKVEVNVPYRSACDGLHRMITALEKEAAIPIDVKQASIWANSTQSFMDAYREFKDTEKRFTTSKAASKLFDKDSNLQVLHIPQPKLDVIDASSDNFVDQFAETIENAMDNVVAPLWSVTVSRLLEYFLDQPSQALFITGVLILGPHLRLSWVATLALSFITLGIMVGMSSLLYEVRRFVRTEIENVKMEIESRMDDLFTQMKQLENDGASLVENVSVELRQKVDQHIVDVDARLSMGSIMTVAVDSLLKILLQTTLKK